MDTQNSVREFRSEPFFDHSIRKSQRSLPAPKRSFLTAEAAVGWSFVFDPQTADCEDPGTDCQIDVLHSDTRQFGCEKKLVIKFKNVYWRILTSASQSLKRRLNPFQELIDFPFQIAKRVIPVLAEPKDRHFNMPRQVPMRIQMPSKLCTGGILMARRKP